MNAKASRSPPPLARTTTSSRSCRSRDDRQLQHAAALLAKKPDPRLPTEVAVPPVAEARGIKRLWIEIVDHLWPFNRDSWKGSRILTAVEHCTWCQHHGHAGLCRLQNLLIGAALFWALKATGLMTIG